MIDEILSSIAALFLFACILVGTYTMVLYTVGVFMHWRGIVCG